MGFSYKNQKHVSVSFADPGATTKTLMVFKADQSCEVLSAHATAQNAQGAGSATTFTLVNLGTAGTAVAGTVAAAVGGTASADRLAAATPKAFTISDGTLSAGQWLGVQTAETGDWVEQNVQITVTYVDGIGA